jgi:hypothetical protein
MRFEYKVITLKRSVWGGKTETVDARFQEQLNTLGAQGWRMTGTSPYGHYVQVFLMREK